MSKSTTNRVSTRTLLYICPEIYITVVRNMNDLLNILKLIFKLQYFNICFLFDDYGKQTLFKHHRHFGYTSLKSSNKFVLST